MLRYLITSCALLLLAVTSAAQTTPVAFNCHYHNSSLVSNDSLDYLFKNDSVEITSLRFYVSHIKLYYQHQLVWSEPNSFHLIDYSTRQPPPLFLLIPSNIHYDTFSFDLGIDSVTNTSGVFGGDLDPSKAMYWTWQSGYINLKLEGNYMHSKQPKKEFQFHLGGYAYPYNALRTVTLSCRKQKEIIIDFDITKLLASNNTHHIMSPCKEALLMADQAAQAFGIK